MRVPGFVGPSYTPRSVNVDAERSINLYPENVTDGTGAVRAYLIGTPGLRGFTNITVSGGPVRCLWTQNGRMFAVVGTGFYEVYATGRVRKYGRVVYDDAPAMMCSNGIGGDQILILSGGYGYVFNTLTGVFVRLPVWNRDDPNTPDNEYFPFPCQAIAFIDGYFLALRKDSREVRCTDVDDNMLWPGNAWLIVSTAGDNLRTMIATHRHLWLFGEHNSHIWYNGAPDEEFPFVPLEGTAIEHGILAPSSVVSLDNTLFWLGSDVTGVGVVWRANGYTPERISTHAVEYWLKQCPRLSSSIAWAYQDEGHSFYVLYIPNAETSWVYDIATNAWHERATWNPDTLRWEPHLGRCHCYAFGKHLVGDRSSGQIYEMNLDFYDEDVTPLDSVVVVTSPSRSASLSPSRSESRSTSGSASTSSSTSSSRSDSLSSSPSASRSESRSDSPSVSPSVSGSASSSLSESLSASSSASGAP